MVDNADIGTKLAQSYWSAAVWQVASRPSNRHLKVPLKHGSYTLIDAVDLPLVEGHKWRPKKDPDGRVYAVTTIGKRHVLMHRMIMGQPPGKMVDHWNGVTLDNRRVNLRACTNSQNIANARKFIKAKDASSRFKGVCLYRGLWRAAITQNYKKFNLGDHPTQEAAALAYDEAARRLFGEFARCNFPRGAA